MIAVHGRVPADRRVLEIRSFLLSDKNLDVREDIIGLLVDDFLRNGALTSDSVDDPRPQSPSCRAASDGDDLVGFLVHRDLRQHQPLARSQGRHHVKAFLRTLLLIEASRRFAIDGDDLRRRFGHRRDPGDKAALERFRVEGGEDVAKMIMRGLPFLKGRNRRNSSIFLSPMRAMS
jgi:hypothetical protein